LATGFVDDLVRDSELADVVQQRRELGVPAVALGEPEHLDDGECQVDDVYLDPWKDY
jgi:hypothetical protein